MMGNGRSKWQKKGGGVGLLVRVDAGIKVEELDVGKCEMSEDILAALLEYKGCKNGGSMLYDCGRNRSES